MGFLNIKGTIDEIKKIIKKKAQTTHEHNEALQPLSICQEGTLKET